MHRHSVPILLFNLRSDHSRTFPCSPPFSSMQPLTKARWQMKRARPWMHSDHLWKGHIGEFLFQSMSQSVEDLRHLAIWKGLVWGSSTKGAASMTTISGVIVQELISSLWETDARDQYQKVQMGCWREKERLEGRAFLPLPLSLSLHFFLQLFFGKTAKIPGEGRKKL